MSQHVRIGEKLIGHDCPCYVIAEIGINHNGDIDMARKLIDAASLVGCDAVKFQKRTPELCVPQAQRDVRKETPWGVMSYMEYRERMEFGEKEYSEIDSYCREKGVHWFASCWDEPSVEFIERFNPCAHKVPSALITNHKLLECLKRTGRPLIMSTGMSTMQQIRESVRIVGEKNLVLCHCTSTYPCPIDELNLRMIDTLKTEFSSPIGYSGHEVGLAPTLTAVVLGACLVERHITLDRTLWGSDQAASVEPQGMSRLNRDIRAFERSLGNGIKCVYESEIPIMKKLRVA